MRRSSLGFRSPRLSPANKRRIPCVLFSEQRSNNFSFQFAVGIRYIRLDYNIANDCRNIWSRTLSSTQLLDGFCDRPVAGVSGGQGIESWLACLEFESPVPQKTPAVKRQRCLLNLWRAEMSSGWCGVVVRDLGCQLRCRPSSFDHFSKLRGPSLNTPRVACNSRR
ncbi:hypothetical protein TNCV_2731821 [Trichonephila clavipes]|nr:hypothetical protein TNCV_2731821 [Trichonephila clavipes]